jgi:iron complex transport system permease protein
MQPMTPRRIAGVCAILGGALFVAMVVSLRLGAYPMSVTSVVTTLYHGAIGQMDSLGILAGDFWLAAAAHRAGNSGGRVARTSGAGFQALLRNPLADPYVLGVSSGAALGAILSLIVAPHARARFSSRRLRAGATIAAVYFLGRRGGQLGQPTLLLRESWRRRFFPR